MMRLDPFNQPDRMPSLSGVVPLKKPFAWVRVWALIQSLALGLALACLAVSAVHALPFDVPPQDLGDVAKSAIITAAFYLGTVTVVVSIMAIALSLRQWVWAQYTTLVLLGLAYIALFEQNVTGIVWMGVDLSTQALLVFGYGMFTVNYLVAAQTLPSAHKWAWLKVPFRIASVAVWALWLLGRTGSDERAFMLFSIAGCTVAMAHFVPVSTFSKLRGGYDTAIRNLIWGLLVCVLVGATIVISGAVEGEGLTVVINRVIIAGVTVGFGVLFIRNIFLLQSDRELAVQEALDRAEEQVRTGQELLAAKDDHQAALELAHARTLRLATASHDIRQPLSSLRNLLTTLPRDTPQDMRTHLQASLDYLDDLASTYLTEASDGSDAQMAPGEALAQGERVGDDDAHIVQADQIGQTLQRMFEGDAAKQDLTLTVDVAPAPLDTHPLALMRVLCNVMSNAIVHGAPGPLRLEGQGTAQGYRFTVTNPGSATLEFGAWEKGAQSDGHGLGLAIVDEQAAMAGLVVTTPVSRDGTVSVTVTVPPINDAPLAMSDAL